MRWDGKISCNNTPVNSPVDMNLGLVRVAKIALCQSIQIPHIDWRPDINLDHQPNAMRTVPASSPVSVGYGLNPFRPVIRSTQVNLNFGWWAESTTACYSIHSRWFGYWAIFGLQISGTWFVQFEGSASQFALLLISNMLHNVPLVEVTRVKPCTWQHEKRDCQRPSVTEEHSSTIMAHNNRQIL